MQVDFQRRMEGPITIVEDYEKRRCDRDKHRVIPRH